MLKKCISDLVTILYIEGLGVNEDLSYQKVPMEILDHQVIKLKNKEVVSINIIWINHLVDGRT